MELSLLLQPLQLLLVPQQVALRPLLKRRLHST